MNMPLAGVRVVELATVVAAPTTSRMLCAYGAEVVKVETLYGDEMRRAGKTELTPYEDYKNPLFTVHNSNKRLTSINFKDPEGKAALLKLIGEADVFITNVREASLRRSGLDYDTLRESFPQLIYAHFSGFGPKGPVASNPGFDSTGFWLRSGPMADWQVEGSVPLRADLRLRRHGHQLRTALGHTHGPARPGEDRLRHQGRDLALRERHLVQLRRRRRDPVRAPSLKPRPLPPRRPL